MFGAGYIEQQAKSYITKQNSDLVNPYSNMYMNPVSQVPDDISVSAGLGTGAIGSLFQLP